MTFGPECPTCKNSNNPARTECWNCGRALPTTTEDSITLWSVGKNMPGYLPMADEPTLCDSWEGAKNSLLWEIDSMLDYLSEGESDDLDPEDEETAWIANLQAARVDLVASEGPEWGTIVDDCPSGTSYWVVQVTVSADEVNDE